MTSEIPETSSVDKPLVDKPPVEKSSVDKSSISSSTEPVKEKNTEMFGFRKNKKVEEEKDNKMMLTVLLSSIPGLKQAKGATYTWFIRIKFAIFQVVTALVLLITLLWASVFLYSCFHYWYMPTVASYERPVHLKFPTHCDNIDGLCGFPNANISLISKNQKEILVSGQPYSVFLELEMPESYVNQRLGMFMIQAEFYTEEGVVLYTASKSVMMHFKSYLYRIIETFWILPSLLYGSMSEKQMVYIELTNNYRVDSYRPTRGVYLEIQNRRVEIYSSWIRIHASFAGLRYLLYYWPRVSAFFGVAMNFFFLSVLTIFSWLVFGNNASQQTEEAESEKSEKSEKKMLEEEPNKTNDLNKNSETPQNEKIHKGSGGKKIGDLYDDIDDSPQFVDAVENLAAAGRFYKQPAYARYDQQASKKTNANPGIRRRIVDRLLQSFNVQ